MCVAPSDVAFAAVVVDVSAFFVPITHDTQMTKKVQTEVLESAKPEYCDCLAASAPAFGGLVAAVSVVVDVTEAAVADVIADPAFVHHLASSSAQLSGRCH